MNISGISLNDIEYCTLVGNAYFNNTYFRVKLTKLTPYEITNNKRNNFNPNILVNDSSCKPSVSNYVTSQNYFTIKRSDMCDLSPIADSNGIVKDGTILICRCSNGNFNTLTIIDSKK